MIKKTILLLVFVLLLLNSKATNEIKYHFHISQNEGLRSNKINSIAEDYIGRIWICNDDGIDIFNGKRTTSLTKMTTNIDLKKDNPTSILSIDNKMVIVGQKNVYEFNCVNNSVVKVLPRKFKKTPASLVKKDSNCYLLIDNKIYKRQQEKWTILLENALYNNITVGKHKYIWVATYSKVILIGQDGNILKTYNLRDHIPDIIITTIYCDVNGVVWVGSKASGIFRLDKNKDLFVKALPEKKQPKNVCSLGDDDYGNLWIGYNEGLVIYDYINQTTQWPKLTNPNGQTFNATVCQIFRTSENDMVLGTFFNGVFYVKNHQNEWNFIQVTSKDNTVGVAINNILQRNNGELVIATNNEGIHFYNTKKQQIKFLNNSNSIIPNNIIALCEDHEETLWLGSESNGLFALSSVDNIKHYSSSDSSLSSNLIYVIKNIGKDSLLICNSSNIQILSITNNRFINIASPNSPSIDAIVNDSNIWVCCESELIKYNKNKDSLLSIPAISDNGINLKFSSCFLENDTIWLGTERNSLFYLDSSNRIKQYKPMSEFHNTIIGMVIDKRKQLWLATTNGLYRKKRDAPIEKLNTRWGLNTNRFNIRSSLYINDTIYFGSINGLCYFNSQLALTKSKPNSKLLITDIYLPNNRQKDNKQFRTMDFDETKEIELNYNQKIISFEIEEVNFNIQDRANNEIFYQLEGFSDTWNKLPDNSNLITYTTLAPGKYKLNIKLVGKNVIDFKSLNIRVNPHFLLNRGMLFLYIILGILLLIGILFLIRLRSNEKLKIKITEMEKKQIQKLTNLKLDFFTYVTNELKNPLSVLVANNKKLYEKNFSRDSEEYSISERNINRLLILVNQLVEFRATETEQLTVSYSKANISDFCENISKLFAPLFKSKQIAYEFTKAVPDIVINFDHDKVEKIIGNILSNILKISKTNTKFEFIVKQNSDFTKVLLSFYISKTTLPENKIKNCSKHLKLS